MFCFVERFERKIVVFYLPSTLLVWFSVFLFVVASICLLSSASLTSWSLWCQLICLLVQVVVCTQLTYQGVGMTALALCKMITLTSRDIYTWIVIIVVLHVELHVHCGTSMSSQIWVNKCLSNSITDSGVSYWCALNG